MTRNRAFHVEIPHNAPPSEPARTLVLMASLSSSETPGERVVAFVTPDSTHYERIFDTVPVSRG